MNQVFCSLDDGKATLRILYSLHGGWEQASRGQLEEKLDRNGVGRSAFYSSLKVLHELGLIFETRKRVDGKNLLFTELTEKGDKIVKAINELYTAIEQEYPEKNKQSVLKIDHGEIVTSDSCVTPLFLVRNYILFMRKHFQH